MSRFFSSRYSNLTPYVPGEQPQDRKYIKLNTNESPFPPSPLAVRMARNEAGALNLYSDPECRTLLAAAAEYFGIAEDEIVFTNGSDDALNFSFMAFGEKDAPVIFPDITYGFYPVFAKLNKLSYETVPVREDFSINADDYLARNGMIVLANPNAQTGIALPLREIEKIVKSNPEHVVVIDEAYVDFGGESAVALIHKYDNLLVTGTFSKSRNLAGARLGFGIGNRELIRDMNTLRFSTNPYNINRMTMAAGAGALTDVSYFRKCVGEITAVREETAKALRSLGFVMTESSANFLLIRHPKIGGKELYLKLKENGILVRHFDDERIKDYNRVTIGSRDEMTAFLAQVKAILKERS